MTPHPNFDVMKFVKKLRKDAREDYSTMKFWAKGESFVPAEMFRQSSKLKDELADQLETYAKTGEVK